MESRLNGSPMTENTDVGVTGGGYSGVTAANRVTQRDDLTKTLITPRTSFVERVRLHQLEGGPDAFVDVVAKAEPNPPPDAEHGVAAMRHSEDGVTP